MRTVSRALPPCLSADVPFTTARQAPGAMYDGSFGTENRGGTILYQPDSGDDFDDEEDED